MILKNRLISAFFDFFLLCLAFIIVGIILETFGLVHPGSDSIVDKTVSFLLFIIFINKDFFRSRSIGKRIFGLKIVNKSDLIPATSKQCLIRNLTILIWPIEVITLLFSSNERIGDLIAGTKVVISDKEPWTAIFDDIKKALMR